MGVDIDIIDVEGMRVVGGGSRAIDLSQKNETLDLFLPHRHDMIAVPQL